MKTKLIVAAVALSMISSTAFAENGCPIGLDRIELVNPNQVLVHGPYGDYLRTVANSDLCDNIRLRVSSQCCIQRSYRQTSNSGGGGDISIDHKTANALAAVAVIGVTALLIHNHHKKVEAQKAAALQAAAKPQTAPAQSPVQLASADQPESYVLDGVVFTKYHPANEPIIGSK